MIQPANLWSGAMKPAALAAALAMLPLAASAGCLGYDQPVELRGTLRRHTFAEQPNYESLAKGDRPASCFFVTLKPPVCERREGKRLGAGSGQCEGGPSSLARLAGV